jgi:thiol:disulfide interchange protein
MARPFVLAALLLAAPASANAQVPTKLSDVAIVSAEVVPEKPRRGETVTYRFTAAPKTDGWVYPIKPSIPGQESKTSLIPPAPGDLIFVTQAVDPPGFKWKEKLGDTGLHQISTTPVTWEMKAVVSPRATPGKKSVVLDKKETSVPACNDFGCVNIAFDGRDLPVADYWVQDGDPVPVEEQFKAAVEKALNPPAPVSPPSPRSSNGGPDSLGPKRVQEPGKPKDAKPAEQVEAELKTVLDGLDKTNVPDATKSESVGAFVVTAVIWGLVSLVTPCVFPMIPITVSIFLKHAHGSFRERMKLAAVYCGTIIVVLGLSAFALLKFMAWLSVHPVTNVLLGLLFVVLALSLFGMYELTLPNFMVKRLQARQSQGGVVGTIFGALAFTVISFTCVAPFLGGFAGISAAGASSGSLVVVPTTKEILGGLAFATAFAAPFFVLALVPGLLRALPKSGGWLDSVKVVMGFLEIAAALKFFRTAELGVFSPTQYFTFDFVLAGWVAISFACGLYLLNAYRLPHDEDKPNIGVPRLLFAVSFLGLGFYLLPAIFKGPGGETQRPAGAVYAWVDAFLLPEPRPRERDNSKHLEWQTDLSDSIARVRDEGRKSNSVKPIIVDFTGVTCTNCSYNENQVFPAANIRELLERYERVQLYTDWLPAEIYAADPGLPVRKAEGRANRKFKIDAFGTDQLPLYVQLLPTPDGKVKVLGVYDEGKINQPDRFAAWLNEGLEKAKR